MSDIVLWRLTQQQANYLMGLIDERPHREVRQLVDSIIQQMQQTQQPPDRVPPPDTTKGETAVASESVN